MYAVNAEDFAENLRLMDGSLALLVQSVHSLEYLLNYGTRL